MYLIFTPHWTLVKNSKLKDSNENLKNLVILFKMLVFLAEHDYVLANNIEELKNLFKFAYLTLA